MIFISWHFAILLPVFLNVSLYHSSDAVGVQCVNCRYGECKRSGSFDCLYGCIEGWAGSDCSVNCTIDRCIDCYVTDSGEEECRRCEGGSYGTDCRSHCSSNCYGGDKLCDSQGRCIHGCVSGWQGDRCDELTCTFTNCSICDKTWDGTTYCKACIAGYYSTGYECEPCSESCVGGSLVCDTEDGSCPNGCVGNWFGDRCNQQCSLDHCEKCGSYINYVSCRECSPGYYPIGGVCTLCAGHCIGSCSGIDGHCPHGCQTGWLGDKCNQECTILNCETCNLTLFNDIICSSCKPGYYVRNSQCLNCSVYCSGGRENCDRSEGWCLGGCVPGSFGHRCDYFCSSHCVNNICNATYGYCTCDEGWYGDRCDLAHQICPVHCNCDEGYSDSTCNSCEPGYFGPLCQKKCGDNCQLRECNKTTGYCLGGCQAGFYGDFCNRTSVCTGLWYGERCQFRCSDNCYEQSPGSRVCHSSTGQCLFGCTPGYHGYFCNLSCPENCKDKLCDSSTGLCTGGCEVGFYTPNCTLPCPGHCRDNSCFSDTGNCRQGCKSGYYGWKCNQLCGKNCVTSECRQHTAECSVGCVSGFYGKTCSEICTDRCSNNTCYRSSGLCLECKEGFSGKNCDQDIQTSEYSRGKNVNTVAITTGVVGGVVLLSVVGVVLFVIYRRKQQQRKRNSSLVVTYVRNPGSVPKPVDSDRNPEADDRNSVFI